jgi:hypothetical protein
VATSSVLASMMVPSTATTITANGDDDVVPDAVPLQK